MQTFPKPKSFSIQSCFQQPLINTSEYVDFSQTKDTDKIMEGWKSYTLQNVNTCAENTQKN